MEVLIITIFCSLMLVLAGLLLFFKGVKEGDFEHGDRLSLLPLEEDEYPEAPLEDSGGVGAVSEVRDKGEGERESSLPKNIST